MAVSFEGNAYLDPAFITNSTITMSNITTSMLDMNMENINNVKDPITDQDAATKKYIDDIISSGTTVTSLTGTTGSLAFNITKGTYIVKVSNQVLNGPSALFQITKNEAAGASQIQRTCATPGDSSDTTLLVDWEPSLGIYVRKTSDLYDGDYVVQIV